MTRFRQIFLLLISLLVLANSALPQQTFTIGADLSWLPELINDGVEFYDDGIEGDIYDILQDHGVNTVRLRLWHTPDDPWNGFDSTLAHAIHVKEMGFDLLLDFHYSDSWADPARQTPPAAWQGLTFSQVEDSVRTYTENVIRCFNDAGALPDMVQIGNEILNGFLWDYGAVTGRFNTPAQWTQFTDLLKAGIEGVEAGSGGENVPLIMIHSNEGGDLSLNQYFFNMLEDYEVEFDLIGLSYYPWWHGDLDDLQANIENLVQCYSKPVYVVETAYPFTFGWNDDTHNVVGQWADLIENYPATAEGQASYMAALIRVVQVIPDDLGMGVFWWEPCWIAAPTVGSAWENLCWFDFDNNALPVLDSLAVTMDVDEDIYSESLLPDRRKLHIFPNPVNSSFRVELPREVRNIKSVYVFDINGRLVWQKEGWSNRFIEMKDCTSGTYFLRVETQSGGDYIGRIFLLK